MLQAWGGGPRTQAERVSSSVTSPKVKDQFARCGSKKQVSPEKETWSQQTVAHVLHTERHTNYVHGTRT